MGGKEGPDLPGGALGWSVRVPELDTPSRKNPAATWTWTSGLRLRVIPAALLHAFHPSPTLHLTRAWRCPDCDTVFLSCQFQGCLKGPQVWPKHLGVGRPVYPFSRRFPDHIGMFVSLARLREGPRITVLGVRPWTGRAGSPNRPLLMVAAESPAGEAPGTPGAIQAQLVGGGGYRP